MVQRLARSPFKPESNPSNTALSCGISDLHSIQEVTADARRCPSGAIWVQFAPLNSPSLEKAALSIHRLNLAALLIKFCCLDLLRASRSGSVRLRVWL